jgi:uncharacterized Rossmann fold enzyme
MKPATGKLSANSTTIEFGKTYGSAYCIPLWLRDVQVKMSMRKVSGRVPHIEEKNSEPIAIVGYGPSLKHTWEKLREFKTIVTTSGAHKFLIERGIIPTYHVDVDPRAHKIAMLGEIRQDVTYMPCSTVHPNYIDALLEAGATVKLWHCFSTELEALRITPAGDVSLTGGADAGMRAMSVARFMGYVNHHVFGMDGCSFDEESHADAHTNAMKKFFDLEYPEGSGRKYRTTPHLLDVAKTVPHEIDMLKLDNVQFYGDGLVRAIVENSTPTKYKESNIAFIKPLLISESYRKEMALRHSQSSLFGSDGFRYQDTVRRLVKATEATSVLDYGCGKGVLAAKLDFPIWEYDPAIEGKEATPKAADLVICTNVLEHVEDEFFSEVMGDLARCVKKVGYFTMGVGTPEHWENVLKPYFYVGKVTLEKGEVSAVVGPKITSIKKKEPVMLDEVVEIKQPEKVRQFGLIEPAKLFENAAWTYR